MLCYRMLAPIFILSGDYDVKNGRPYLPKAIPFGLWQAVVPSGCWVQQPRGQATFTTSPEGVETLKVRHFPHPAIDELLEPCPGSDFQAGHGGGGAEVVAEVAETCHDFVGHGFSDDLQPFLGGLRRKHTQRTGILASLWA